MKKEKLQIFKPDFLKTFKKTSDSTFLLQTQNNVHLSVQVTHDFMFRFRYSANGYFEDDFSYAIKPDITWKTPVFTFSETEAALIIKTALLICHIQKQDLLITFRDQEGQVICEDQNGFSLKSDTKKKRHSVLMNKKIQRKESFLGLGDKPFALNLRGKKLENYGTDAYKYQEETDPIYKTIPFYIGLHHHISYGIFFDNSYRSFFDFGHKSKDEVTFSAQGGEMNYYFIYGPGMRQVVERYAWLTGTPELPPLWALGYQQCKWSYFPEKKVREIADGFRKRKIPCDVIYLDIDYMDGYRCFTWDKNRFPHPDTMLKDLKKEGFKTVVIIDPGIKVDKKYKVFQEGIKNEVFCKRENGTFMKGKVWPEDCYFPDFTHPEARSWWANLFKELVEAGVAGVWNDMNEPAVFDYPGKTFPDDVQHFYDNHPTDHRKAHNVYGMQMSRATTEGLKKFRSPERPFVITRSGYAGLQRYSSVWTGDNTASWNHLWLANMQCQRLSISGVSFAGSDIGGFTEIPDGELYTRWLQLALFHSFYRTHSRGHQTPNEDEADTEEISEKEKFVPMLDREPWTFGEEFTEINKRIIELRYQLLPYLYTAFWQHVTQGTPILRSMTMLCQKNEVAYQYDAQFGWGDHILACPVMKQGAEKTSVFLPEGKWYYYWTNELYKGSRKITVQAPLKWVPFFVKAGAVIPQYPVIQYVGEKKIEELSLHVYYKNGEEKSSLYEDNGSDYQYAEGKCNHKVFITAGTDTNLTIQQQTEGSFATEYDRYKVIIYGLPFNLSVVEVDGQVVSEVQSEQRFGVHYQFLTLTNWEKIVIS